MAESCKSQEEDAIEAINNALKKLFMLLLVSHFRHLSFLRYLLVTIFFMLIF